jgi:multidrug efflux pump subunit AcrB
LRGIADARVTLGPQVFTRYNNYRAIPIQGSPAPGTSSGTAQISRRDAGTPVFAGMIAASGIGLFVIPMLYVTFQSLSERTGARFPRARMDRGAAN